MNADPAPCAGASYNRRGFVSVASGCLLCGLVTPSARAGTDRPIDVGTLKDYPKDEISEKYIQNDIFVIRHKGKLFAATAICPHQRGYLLRDPKKPTRIICASHNWRFDAEGAITSGPEGKDLERFAISVNDKGRVLVDTSRSFQRPNWDDKASFVPFP
ncbi:MAG: Rieske (2Fe-2S) protein [Verrucomicrobiae bacterium]|nr:Rieske (2Fe-2S) protein [Verrucomicrobiae bacterium]